VLKEKVNVIKSIEKVNKKRLVNLKGEIRTMTIAKITAFAKQAEARVQQVPKRMQHFARLVLITKGMK